MASPSPLTMQKYIQANASLYFEAASWAILESVGTGEQEESGAGGSAKNGSKGRQESSE